MEFQNTCAIVLAAGKGTRMKSDKAKVLHEVASRPMIYHVLESLIPLSLGQIIVVTGHQHEAVQDAISKYEVQTVYQEEQLGTGHAVACARGKLAHSCENVLILCGDTPLVQSETLKAMLHHHITSNAHLTVMTAVVQDPVNYGRIVKDMSGNVRKIVEEKDCSKQEREICEINAGMYCVNGDILFRLLDKIGTDNAQGEMYLTDIVEKSRDAGLSVQAFTCGSAEEILGVNSKDELARANMIMEARLASN